jgi:hypothetical protein
VLLILLRLFVLVIAQSPALPIVAEFPETEAQNGKAAGYHISRVQQRNLQRRGIKFSTGLAEPFAPPTEDRGESKHIPVV